MEPCILYSADVNRKHKRFIDSDSSISSLCEETLRLENNTDKVYILLTLILMDLILLNYTIQKTRF